MSDPVRANPGARPTLGGGAAAAVVGVFALLALAGGCHRAGGAPDLSRFLGTWTVVSGSLSLVCSNKRNRTLPVTEPIVFVPGKLGHLLDDNAVCPVEYDVAGTVATALPKQICRHPKVVIPLNLTLDTFTTLDGVTGTLDVSGKEDGYIDIVMAWPVNCTFTETASYKRAAP